MYSLFTRIFLSFWLTAILLGGAIYMTQRYLGGDVVQREAELLDAYAATASALYADNGLPAVRRWLEQLGRHERRRLLLLDDSGHLLNRAPLPPPLRDRLEENPFEPGSHRLLPGVTLIVRTVADSEPPLRLAALVRLPRAEELPIWMRVAFALLISGLISFVLALLISRPLRRLRQAAQAIADGDLNARVPVHGRDEVAALGNDFNLMADRVRDLLEAQRRLLRDVSHELRSPLARLRIAVELARSRKDASAMLDRIEGETERLESLIADLLALARLEAGATQLQKAPIAMAELLAGIVQDASFEAEHAGKRVHFEPSATPTLWGDTALLRSAVENVVRNAVRHTAPNTTVTLSLSREDKEAVIQVQDQGEGVPQAELAKLFQPFTRVGEGREQERARGGYGLGLAISRRAVEAHGGQISAANLAEGGLCVTLRLPLTNGASHSEMP